MRVQKRSLGLKSLGVMLAAVALWGAPALADISSDKPGSVVLWPKVINDGTRDTIITLTNTSNVTAYAHCEYVNSAAFCAITGGYCTPGARAGGPGQCPALPGNACVPQWQSGDFDIVLTRQQPTFWRVSTGRQDNPFLPPNGACDTTLGPPATQSCPGLFPTGQILPVAPSFRGELRCVQTAMDGSLITQNSLKGEATLVTTVTDAGGALIDTSVSTYNSINVEGVNGPTVDGIVRLNGVEYSACPPAVEVSHYSSGAPSIAESINDSVCDPTDGCPVEAEITIIPCRADFENEIGAAWTTQIFYYNEFETRTSTGGPADCWQNFDLRDYNYNPVGPFGTEFQRSTIANGGGARCIRGAFNALCSDDDDCGPGGVCGPPTGILAIVEEFHNTAASLADPPTGAAGSAASNGYIIAAADGSLERAGRCRGDITERCTVDAECPSGLCRLSGANCATDTDCPGAGDFCDRCMNDEINFVTIP